MYICGGIFHITHMPEVEIFQMSPHLSWGEIWNYSTCGENLDFYTSVMWRNLKLLHVWNSTHLPCIELWNFSTWQIFSPQIYRWDRWQISGMCNLFVAFMERGSSLVFHHMLEIQSPDSERGLRFHIKPLPLKCLGESRVGIWSQPSGLTKSQLFIEIAQNQICIETVEKCEETHTTTMGRQYLLLSWCYWTVSVQLPNFTNSQRGGGTPVPSPNLLNIPTKNCWRGGVESEKN